MEIPLHEQAKKVQSELRSFLSLDECLRPFIASGYEQAVKRLEDEKASLWALRRGSLPVSEQLAKAQNYVKAATTKLEAEQQKAAELQAESAEIRSRWTPRR